MAAAPKKPPRAKPAASSSPSTPGEERVVLLTGAEAGRKTAEAARLAAQYVEVGWEDFDVDSLDGGTTAADRILSGAATAPMSGGRRVVLVRDTQQMDVEEQKRLAAGIARIPASGFLILHTGSPVVEDGKTKRASIVATELASAVKKVGTVLDFPTPRSDDIRSWAAAEARRLGKTLQPDAVALFAQMSGEDLLHVGSEIAKAAAHAGDAPVITAGDVEATLSRTPDDVIFKLCDAVGMRHAPEALGHVATLFRGGARPEAVAPRALVLLARQVRLLAQFKYLASKGVAVRGGGGGRGAVALPPDILALLPGDGAAATLTNPRTSWMADKISGAGAQFSGRELLDELEILLGADLALKGITGSGESPEVILQRLVVSYAENGRYPQAGNTRLRVSR